MRAPQRDNKIKTNTIQQAQTNAVWELYEMQRITASKLKRWVSACDCNNACRACLLFFYSFNFCFLVDDDLQVHVV